MTEGRDRPPPGVPNWASINSPNVRDTAEFYRALFGWEFETGWEMGKEVLEGYRTFLLDGRRVAGVLPHPDPETPGSWWSVYFSVGDCDTAVARATRAGGVVAVEPADVAGLGRSAVVVDPTGAEFGLWQSRAYTGAETMIGPGSVYWFELVTDDTAAARGFYTAVFGHLIIPSEVPVDMPGTDYWTFGGRDPHAAGARLHHFPGPPGSRWTVYFTVADVDASARAVAGNGGTVRVEPVDTAYGRLSFVTDPFGADFAIVRPAPNPPPR